MTSTIKLGELKEGDKFYHFDGLVYVVYEVNIVNNNYVEIITRRHRTREFTKLTISAINAVNHFVHRYVVRNRASYYAGFKQGIEYCIKHMSGTQVSTAHIDNDVMIHINATEHYNVWKNNNKLK